MGEQLYCLLLLLEKKISEGHEAHPSRDTKRRRGEERTHKTNANMKSPTHEQRRTATEEQPLTLINALWVKISADDILKYFLIFPKKMRFYISSKLSPKETVYMKCQNLFLRKIIKNIISLSSAELVQRVVTVKFVNVPLRPLRSIQTAISNSGDGAMRFDTLNTVFSILKLRRETVCIPS